MSDIEIELDVDENPRNIFDGDAIIIDDDDDDNSDPLNHSCVVCGEEDAPYRQVTQNHLCTACRTKRPHKIIVERTAVKKYKLTKGELGHLVEEGTLTLLKARNYRNPNKPLIFYYDHEVAEVARASNINKQISDIDVDIEISRDDD